jgi:hypothetical protein
MLKNLQAQAMGQRDRGVRAVIIDQNANIYQIGKLTHGNFESLLRVVSGHYHRNAFSVDHFAQASI